MTDAGTVTMSARELHRLEVLGRVIERRLTQRQAAEQLGLSERQVRRLCRTLGRQGAAGLVSRKRGRPSNRKLPATAATTTGSRTEVPDARCSSTWTTRRAG